MTLGKNLSLLTAQRQLNDSSSQLGQSYERLASGLRINKASDDSAGLATALKLGSDSRVYTQAIRNVNDGISISQVVASALDEVMNITIRQKELAEQAANGALSLNQRLSLQSESDALVNEFNRIIASTEFNKVALFNVDETTGRISIQAGYGNDGAVRIDIGLQFLRTVGNGTFATGVAYASGTSPAGGVLAYLNDDEFLDLITHDSFGGTNIRVSLGNGDGTFKTPLATAVGGTASTIAVGDFDNNGTIDVIAGGGTGRFLSGDGDGTFTAGAVFGLGTINDLETADLNGDGDLDLMVATQTGSFALLGNGNGSFTYTWNTNLIAREATVGDFNGDGITDYIDESSLDFQIFIGNGNGTFLGPATYVSGVTVASGEAVDINRDGFLDIVNGSSTSLGIILGNGDGTFKARVSVAGNYSQITVKDFDGDGYLDIASSGSSNVLSLFKGNGDGTFSLYSTMASSNSSSIVAGDVNRDGVLDIVATDTMGRVFLANTDTTNTAPFLYLLSEDGATEAIDTLNSQMNRIIAERGVAGANLSRLEVASENLLASRDLLDAAYSKIMDVDVAEETAKMVRLQVLQNAQAAVLAQGNLNGALVMKLINEN